MNRSEKAYTDRIVGMFEDNYNNLEDVLNKLEKENFAGADELFKKIQTSQEMLIATCEIVDELVKAMKSKKTSDTSIRFNASDADFEEQVERAEKEVLDMYKGTYKESANKAFNSKFDSGRIISFSADLHPDGIDEILAMIREQISDDDNDGGTFYVL